MHLLWVDLSNEVCMIDGVWRICLDFDLGLGFNSTSISYLIASFYVLQQKKLDRHLFLVPALNNFEVKWKFGIQIWEIFNLESS